MISPTLTPNPGLGNDPQRRQSVLLIRIVFAFLLVTFPVAVAIRIRTQRHVIGRSPVILGAAARNAWEAWFERLGPAGLGFWPAAWLWIALGGGAGPPP